MDSDNFDNISEQESFEDEFLQFEKNILMDLSPKTEPAEHEVDQQCTSPQADHQIDLFQEEASDENDTMEDHVNLIESQKMDKNNRNNSRKEREKRDSNDTFVLNGDDSNIQGSEKDVKTEELISLLSSWNLEHVAEHLIDENVFVDILKIMRQHHIERVLKQFDLGTQILFEHKLEEWRKSIGQPMNASCGDISLNNETNVLSLNSRNCSSPYSIEPPTVEVPPTILARILKENPKAEMLAEYYKTHKRFSEEQRALLVSAIAQFYEQKRLSMSLAASYSIEHDIINHFPTEKLEYYRTSKRGKIYNKCSNLRAILKSATKDIGIDSNQNGSQHSGVNKQKSVEKNLLADRNFVPEYKAEIKFRSLKTDLSSVQFEHNWQACSQYRLHDIKNMDSNSVLKKWYFYLRPSGYRLIDLDFKTLFDTDDCLLRKWEHVCDKIINFLNTESRVKDKEVRRLLASLSADNWSQNERDASILISIHGYLVPTHKKIDVDRTGKKNTIKYTIKDSQQSFLFVGKNEKEISDHLLYLKSANRIQPIILCVGDHSATSSLKHIYVCFNKIKYSFTSFIKAVDVCYKMYFVFNLKFPDESILFWNFIENYFYGMKSHIQSTKVPLLMEELKA